MILSKISFLRLVLEMRKDLKSVLNVLLVLCAAVFLLFAGVYVFLFRPNFTRAPMHREEDNIKYFDGNKEFHERHIADKKYILSLSPKMHEITSFDGLKLRAFVLEKENSVGSILLMHGFHSDPLREFATLARFYYEMGYNVVLPFQRAHGESEGKYLTFGVKERFDCRDWLIEITKLYGENKPLFLEGISMGCATALMASSLDGLPKNLCGIIADCGFTTPYEIMYFVAKKERHLPMSEVILDMANMMTRFFAGFDLNDASTISALKKNTVPVLFIHGTADDFVPFVMTWQNYEVCKAEKQLLAVDGAKHAVSNVMAYDKYTKAVKEFLSCYKNNMN